MPHATLTACAAALLAICPAVALALDEQRAEVQEFIRHMAERHGFAVVEVGDVLHQAESRPAIVAAMKRPAEKTLAWHEYRAKFLTERRIVRGVETGRQQAAALQRAAGHGVPAEVLLAITGVETSYGENTGKYRVVDALSTLAFDYPPRSTFFRGELENFLLMTRDEALDPLVPVGSYAGAMGIPQFMPSSFRNWAVDGDGDGRRDLWGNWSDVFASIGNYLKGHGWRAGEPAMVAADVTGADLAGVELTKVALSETAGSLRRRGVKFDAALPDDAPAVLLLLTGAAGPEYRVGFTNFYAITRYNRSMLYASAVNDLAVAIAAATPPIHANQTPP
jgi:membrane-bound lytic murein transglycosylase B